MTKTPCIRPEDHPVPISAWVSPLGISFGHQVADDAKTGSGTTEKHENQGFLGELAGEPGFEPRLTESESAVLPLKYSPIARGKDLGMAMQVSSEKKPEAFLPRNIVSALLTEFRTRSRVVGKFFEES